MMCIIRLFFIALSGMATLLAGSVAGAPACVQVVIPTAGGAFAQTGQRLDGYLLAGNTSIDYFGGGPKEYRHWFVFRVPTFAGPLVGAEFRLHAGTMISDSGSEVWEVHHVASGITNFLQPLPVPAPGVFSDLGDGPSYGSAVLSSNQNSRVY